MTILYDVIKDKDISGKTKIRLIESFDSVLSLDLLKKDNIDIDNEFKKYIDDMIKKRDEYKKNKEYDKADSVRDELKSKGVIIKDTREGTVFEIIS